MEGPTRVTRVRVSTPFGPPSDEIAVGDLEGVRVAFLARHGRGHRLSPSEINYRANIYALKRSEEHTSELQSQSNLVCRLLLEKKKNRHSHKQYGQTPVHETRRASVLLVFNFVHPPA